jgi:hypothetical protein
MKGRDHGPQVLHYGKNARFGPGETEGRERCGRGRCTEVATFLSRARLGELGGFEDHVCVLTRIASANEADG